MINHAKRQSSIGRKLLLGSHDLQDKLIYPFVLFSCRTRNLNTVPPAFSRDFPPLQLLHNNPIDTGFYIAWFHTAIVYIYIENQ